MLLYTCFAGRQASRIETALQAKNRGKLKGEAISSTAHPSPRQLGNKKAYLLELD